MAAKGRWLVVDDPEDPTWVHVVPNDGAHSLSTSCSCLPEPYQDRKILVHEEIH